MCHKYVLLVALNDTHNNKQVPPVGNSLVMVNFSNKIIYLSVRMGYFIGLTNINSRYFSSTFREYR